MVRPSVNGDFVTGHVLRNKDIGVRDDTGPNDEERSREVLVVQVLQQPPVAEIT